MGRSFNWMYAADAFIFFYTFFLVLGISLVARYYGASFSAQFCVFRAFLNVISNRICPAGMKCNFTTLKTCGL